jgi:aldehyde dehydrogenase (NAD+)
MTINPPSQLDAPMIAKALRATFDSGRTRSVEWRKAQLEGLLRMLVEQEATFIEALQADLGRPDFEAYFADIGAALGEVRLMAKNVRKWMEPERVRLDLKMQPGKAFVQPEPLGVVLVIAPWNYPIQLLVEPVAAALAAGNCVVAKPSEMAPHCSAALAEQLPRYVDPEALTVVEGGVDETTALLAEKWDHIFFTGSTAVGRVVAEAAAKHLTPTTLELGGKSPTYVHASADLEVTARRIVWGKFLNAGQTCIAPDYVLADRSIKPQLVDKLQQQIANFYGADPKASDSLSRIVNERHVARLQRLLDAGAGTVVAGGQVDAASRYIAPTITVDPAVDSPIMQEEIFGPILPVLEVDGPAEAKAFIKERPKPLALYVFAGNSNVVDDVVGDTSSGGVCVNQTLMHIGPPDLPFGGVGDSGIGAYHGKAGFDVFSHFKSVLHKPTRPDMKLLYPPYKPILGKLVRKIFR